MEFRPLRGTLAPSALRRKAMSTESTRQLFNEYMAALEQGDKSPAVIDRFVSDPKLKEHIAMYESAFPGYTLEAEDIIVEGDRVALRATFRGVHGGNLGNIPPSGREVSAPVAVFYRYTDGMISDHWLVVDMMRVLEQIGAAGVGV
jgi:predicted ester cyclase